jgi:hypothetical protein
MFPSFPNSGLGTPVREALLRERLRTSLRGLTPPRSPMFGRLFGEIWGLPDQQGVAPVGMILDVAEVAVVYNQRQPLGSADVERPDFEHRVA